MPPPCQLSAVNFYIEKVPNSLTHYPKVGKKLNLSPLEIAALHTLRQRNDIVIRPADKGGATVV